MRACRQTLQHVLERGVIHAGDSRFLELGGGGPDCGDGDSLRDSAHGDFSGGPQGFVPVPNLNFYVSGVIFCCVRILRRVSYQGV